MGQTTVSNTKLATGVVGQFYTTEPQGSRSLILASDDESLNKVGVVATYVDDENEQCGVAASDRFAGIISQPKNLVRETLDAASNIPNGQVAEVINRGYVVVELPAAAAKGDYVYYSDTDGTLTTVAPDGVPPAGHTRLPGGTVEMFNVTEAGIAVIYVDFAGDKSDSTGS